MSNQCWVLTWPSSTMMLTTANPASSSPTMSVNTHRTLMPGACLCILGVFGGQLPAGPVNFLASSIAQGGGDAGVVESVDELLGDIWF